MLVSELIAELQKYPPWTEICILSDPEGNVTYNDLEINFESSVSLHEEWYDEDEISFILWWRQRLVSIRPVWEGKTFSLED